MMHRAKVRMNLNPGYLEFCEAFCLFLCTLYFLLLKLGEREPNIYFDARK